MENVCGGNITMTTKRIMKMMWIDDEPEHEDIAKNLEYKNEALKILFVNPEKFEQRASEVPSIDIFLIDDRLQKTISRELGGGISFAAKIREQSPETPIYMFSAIKDETGIHGNLAQVSENLADSILDLKKIQRSGHNLIYFDAEDYLKIRESKRESVEELLYLLNAPEKESERIVLALPENLKNGLSSPSTTDDVTGNSIAFSKWVKQIFLEFPGFVLDSAYASVKLGLTRETFLEKSSIFKDAKYSGIFSRSLEDDKWWDLLLKNIIFELAIEKISDLEETDPRKISRILFDLDNSNIPRCVVCGEEYPDTIGLHKDNDEIKEPVHYRCSVHHPKKTRMIYFDEIRQFEYK